MSCELLAYLNDAANPTKQSLLLSFNHAYPPSQLPSGAAAGGPSVFQFDEEDTCIRYDKIVKEGGSLFWVVARHDISAVGYLNSYRQNRSCVNAIQQICRPWIYCCFCGSCIVCMCFFEFNDECWYCRFRHKRLFLFY